MASNYFTMPSSQPINFIFIDGSYFNFYRYHSLLNWWKHSHPDDDLEDPYSNTLFVEKFKKTFVSHLENIAKKLKIHKTNYHLLVGKDCKRANIWRNSLFNNYKANRNYDGFLGTPFFKMVYDENLFIKGGAKYILSHPHLEADDCIALTTKYVLNKYINCNVYIITSDKDYLQLSNNRVHLYNLSFKKFNHNTDASCDLFCKILMGDTSDNIPSVFPKCGPKTALKYYNDTELFEKKLNSDTKYIKQYELNRTLIDFDCIPVILVDEFFEKKLN
jgi:5'-3' exonuclease